MCQKESWGAIFVTKEVHSTQRGQPPRMHDLHGLWRYEQKEQRVTRVPMSGVNCDLCCPGCTGTAEISEVGRSKTQDAPPDYATNTKYGPLLEGQPVEYIKHVYRYVCLSIRLSISPIVCSLPLSLCLTGYDIYVTLSPLSVCLCVCLSSSVCLSVSYSLLLCPSVSSFPHASGSAHMFVSFTLSHSL